MAGNWSTVTVAAAMTGPSKRTLYASPRGHLIVSIARSGTWYIVSYSSGGKRHVRADKLLYFREVDNG